MWKATLETPGDCSALDHLHVYPVMPCKSLLHLYASLCSSVPLRVTIALAWKSSSSLVIVNIVPRLSSWLKRKHHQRSHQVAMPDLLADCE